MKTILVSGASSVIGYGILRSLRASKEYRLVGTTIYDDSIAPAFCDIFELAPRTDDEKYTDWLIETINKHKIDVAIPGIELDVQFWNSIREKIAESGAKVLLNNSELIELCADKWSFYKRLKDVDSSFAIESRDSGDFESLKSELGLPFLLKPKHGSASSGISLVSEQSVFDKYAADLGSVYIAQNVVGSEEEEYTTAGFFDDSSKLCCSITLKRKLSKAGYTEKAEIVDLAEIEPTLNELANIFKPIGPTNFQFRLHDGMLKLLEINPRISSANSIRTGFGYNESVMSVEYLLNGKLPQGQELKRGYAVRYIEDHFFYDSNTV